MLAFGLKGQIKKIQIPFFHKIPVSEGYALKLIKRAKQTHNGFLFPDRTVLTV